jgi:hypothetical protein
LEIKEDILGNEKRIFKQELFEEGKYKFLIKNKQNTTVFGKSQIFIEYFYQEKKEKILDAKEEFSFSLFLTLSDLPCKFNWSITNLNYFQKIPLEISLFQEYEKIVEKELKPNETLESFLELNSLNNGIYKIFIKNKTKSLVKFNLTSFSYSQENIVLSGENIFISPSFPIIQDTVEAEDGEEDTFLIKVENSKVPLHLTVVRCLETKNLINSLSNQQEFRKKFQNSLKEKDIDLINQCKNISI